MGSDERFDRRDEPKVVADHDRVQARADKVRDGRGQVGHIGGIEQVLRVVHQEGRQTPRRSQTCCQRAITKEDR